VVDVFLLYRIGVDNRPQENSRLSTTTPESRSPQKRESPVREAKHKKRESFIDLQYLNLLRSYHYSKPQSLVGSGAGGGSGMAMRARFQRGRTIHL